MSDSYIIINAGPEVSCAHPFILEVMVRKLVSNKKNCKAAQPRGLCFWSGQQNKQELTDHKHSKPINPCTTSYSQRMGT